MELPVTLHAVDLTVRDLLKLYNSMNEGVLDILSGFTLLLLPLTPLSESNTLFLYIRSLLRHETQ